VGNNPQNIAALHDKYGDVVRIRPDMLTFRTAEAWKEIYGSRPGKGQLQKDPRFYNVGSETQSHIIFCSDADHTRMRRLISHAFSDAALRQQESIMSHYFELLVTQLKKKVDGPEKGVVDMALWYNSLTFDIIGDMCFGESFGALESGVHHKWMSNLLEGAKYGRFIQIFSFYQPLWMILETLMKVIPAVGEAHKEHNNFTRLKTRKRLESKVDRPDFMSYILRYNDERGMSNEEIEGSSGLFIIAGSETTATTLSGLNYFLLRNPRVYAKVQAEVRNHFATAEDITLTSSGQLPYLQACITETQRMYPAVPLALPRVIPNEGAIIGGKFIPGGMRVAVPQYATNYSKTNFFEPETFVPERHLPNPPEQYKNDDLDSMQPFSTGPRNCLGKK
jgi:cytochrome P450